MMNTRTSHLCDETDMVSSGTSEANTYRVVSLRVCRQRRKVDLRDLLAVSVEAAVLGGREVKTFNC